MPIMSFKVQSPHTFLESCHQTGIISSQNSVECQGREAQQLVRLSGCECQLSGCEAVKFNKGTFY